MAIPARVNKLRPAPAAFTLTSSGAGFRLQGSFANSGHGGSRESSRRYRAGDTVRQSGIYEVIHDRSHRDAHEVVMISGERFPDCETCKERVRFRLVRTAPYIFQDEDFEDNA